MKPSFFCNITCVFEPFLYDKDKMSKDDLLGITEIPAEQLRSKKAVLQAPVLGSKTTKAGTKMNMVLLN